MHKTRTYICAHTSNNALVLGGAQKNDWKINRVRREKKWIDWETSRIFFCSIAFSLCNAVLNFFFHFFFIRFSCAVCLCLPLPFVCPAHIHFNSSIDGFGCWWSCCCCCHHRRRHRYGASSALVVQKIKKWKYI